MAARKDWADSQETAFLAQITVEMTASQCWPSHCDAVSYSWRKEEGREREGLRGGVREADTNKGKSQGLECEAVRSDTLNREYDTLDHDGAEDKAPKPNNG